MVMQVITADTLIDTEQHFKVVAGPGAGKTRFLVNHMKNVLKNSGRLSVNKRIACITYTNVGVDTLLDRVKDEKDHIEISTIHGFLFTHIVKPYLFLLADKFGINPAKFDSPFEHIFAKGYFIKTDLPRRYVSEDEMRKKIYWELAGDDCVLRIRDKQNIYHKSLLKYKSPFWEKGIMHYDDILAFAWVIINKNENILRIIRAKFPYFFIDEFQDTSPIQTAIVKKISKKETIIGVIGDEAQSIYSFQGASMKQFIDFELPAISEYIIKDNYRSTKEILDVLKIMRGNLTQVNPKNKTGLKPKILIGDSIKALDECENIFGEKNVVSLSYMIPTANAMRKRINVDSPANKVIEELFSSDGDRDRKKIMISVIKSLEYARQSLFNDAIKELAHHFKLQDEYKGQKSALVLIKSFLNLYEDIINENLWSLYQKVLASTLVSFTPIRENKKGHPSKVETFYKNTQYKELALTIRLIKDESIHRTIHKAKGDEFDNVLVIVKGQYGKKYKEERDLAFLLSPDLINLEEHRVNYVACSRAKENLIINLPEMTKEVNDKLKDYFDISSV